MSHDADVSYFVQWDPVIHGFRLLPAGSRVGLLNDQAEWMVFHDQPVGELTKREGAGMLPLFSSSDQSSDRREDQGPPRPDDKS
jgi:hypothetical protein